jgi:hypothetical protein
MTSRIDGRDGWFSENSVLVVSVLVGKAVIDFDEDATGEIRATSANRSYDRAAALGFSEDEPYAVKDQEDP